MVVQESGGIPTGTIAINSSIILNNGGIFLSKVKKFENLDSQISKLESRGMIIKDHELCKRFLLTNNYYNIINGYSKYFQVRSNSDLYL